MSNALALVKFLDTGNIYVTVYRGTTDNLFPRLFKVKDYANEKYNYSCFDYMRSLIANEPNWIEPKDVELFPVEIYSDYGGGFFWDGLGNENLKFVSWNYCPICYGNIDYVDGVPEWAKQFIKDKYESL